MNPRSLPHKLTFESFGVTVTIRSNDAVGLALAADELPNVLAGRFTFIADGPAEHSFEYIRNENGLDSLYRDGRLLIGSAERLVVLDQLNIHIRLTIAEFAVGHVFIHAGVVAWNGSAIVIPGKSFSGKSTLVVELVRLGALYYSDEYAVLDEDGLVTPFPKRISLRANAPSRVQTDHDVETFGGEVGTAKIPVGLIVLTRYVEGAEWTPVELSSGRAVMAVIADSIPVRNAPRKTLSVLTRVAEYAKVIESPRGDAAETAAKIISYLEPRKA